MLNRIKENGMKIHKDKCLFQVSFLEYLGFRLDKAEIHKNKDKVKVVKAA